MRTKTTLRMLASVPALIAVALAQPPGFRPSGLPEGATVHRDLAYVSGGQDRQKLDLYLPKDGMNLPLTINIHGGAFKMGSKEQGVPVEYLAQGYAIASINYRLSQHAVFPAQIEDPKVGELTREFLAKHLEREGPTLAVPTPVPTPVQAAWHDYEIGMFIHFAPNTWFDQEYDDLSKPPSEINPTALDADQWVRVAESMGAKYIVFVAKHVGGFCWWQTDTSDYGVRQTPWRGGQGDLMAELAVACRKRNLNLGVYLSPADRHHGVGVGGRADDPARQSAYERIFRQQLTELLSRYGEMKEVWFDGSLVFDVGDILQQHAPGAVMFQGPQASIRWVGNEDGVAPYPAWNAVRSGRKPWGTYTAADGDPSGDRWLPNECDARLRNTWFWRTDNLGTLKTVDQLMQMYLRSVGHGAVLLLNNTPDPTGLIPAPDAARSAEFGQEIKRRFGTPIIDTAGSGTNVPMMLSAPRRVGATMIMEDLPRGERIREYVVEGNTPTGWSVLASGTAVGHKKIDVFEPVEVTELRLRIAASVGKPFIRRFAAYEE